MPKGRFITLKDIQIVCGISESQAAKRKRTIKDILGKRKNITISEFCAIEEISEQEFNRAINER